MVLKLTRTAKPAGMISATSEWNASDNSDCVHLPSTYAGYDSVTFAQGDQFMSIRPNLRYRRLERSRAFTQHGGK
ncbi:hypothetical protein CJ178_25840 [Rhodococcus sp. ACPA4]|nr:hypothetical protein CJ178_25840 [Rhodococcus sp. ACPA4]PSR38583.1 hypothetical protein C7T36_26500 [Rhodococcus sp. AD45-ID]ROZ44214.1 hypothetical protein EEB13_24605 [Rhodococcus sp. WS3]